MIGQQYKTRAAEPVRWPGTELLVGLAVLGQDELDLAQICAEHRCRAFGLEPKGEQFETELQVQQLARALRSPVWPWSPLGTADDVRQLEQLELAALHAQWEAIQAADLPDADELKGQIVLALHGDPAVILDGLRAYCATDATAFYGEPSCGLTAGQIAYYTQLRAGFVSTFVEPGSSRKLVSRKRWQRN